MSEDPDMGHPVALCAMDASCAWQKQIPRLWARNDKRLGWKGREVLVVRNFAGFFVGFASSE
jgi:hypothetical protein